MLSVLITIVHVIVCAVLIVVVLLQHGKSADIAATFGGMGSQTAFGPRGTATVFSRLTTWCAIIFMLTSMGLTYMTSLHGSSSVMQGSNASGNAKKVASRRISFYDIGPQRAARFVTCSCLPQPSCGLNMFVVDKVSFKSPGKRLSQSPQPRPFAIQSQC